MTRYPALVYENTEVVIVQTDAKTFADMFQYPICNLCAVNLLYFAIYQRLRKFVTSTSLSSKHCTPELVWRWLLQTQPQMVTEHFRVNFFRERHYFVTWINDSPNAVDSSAMERRVKFGNPVVHLETTASLLPIFLAKSRWLIFFSLRIESMRAIMSADNWISVRISGDTDESFALNQSCLFLISQKTFIIPRALTMLQYTNSLAYMLILFS